MEKKLLIILVFFRDPLYSLAIIDEHMIATGDENGVVRCKCISSLNSLYFLYSLDFLWANYCITK